MITNTKQCKMWYAVDKYGSSYLYDEKPIRDFSEEGNSEICIWSCGDPARCNEPGDFGLCEEDMPKLTWDDEPVQVIITAIIKIKIKLKVL